MSIKDKTILVVVGIILSLSSFFLYIGHKQISENLEWKIKKEKEDVSTITHCIIQKIYLSYKPRMKIFIDQNPDIVKAFNYRDVDALASAVSATYKLLKQENPYIISLDFYNENGTQFLSTLTGKEEKDNEEINLLAEKALKQKRQLSGFEAGCSSIYYRIIHPVPSISGKKGAYTGTVELRINLKQLFRMLEEKFKAHAVVYFKTLFCPIKGSQKKNSEFHVYRIQEHTLIDYIPAFMPEIPSDLDLGTPDQEKTIGQHNYSIHQLAQLENTDGTKIGTVLAFQDITDENMEEFKFFLTSLLSTFIVLIIAFVVLYFSFNKLIGSLETYRRKLEATVKELDSTRVNLEEQVEQRTFEISIANASLNREIAERTQAQGRLKKLQKRLELILNAAGEGIFGLDQQGNVTFVNNNAAHMLGWKPENMLGKPHHELVHHHHADGSDYPESECPISLAYKDGLLHKGRDEVFWTIGNSPVHVEYISTPIIEQDKLVGAVVVFRDITKELKDEGEKNRLRNRLELILNAAGEGIFGLDQDGKVTFANQAALLMLGFTEEELINKSHHNLVHYRHADGSKFPENECPIYMACRDGMVHFSSNDVFWRKDGSKFKVEYISTPIMENDTLTGAVVVFRDLELHSDLLADGEN